MYVSDVRRLVSSRRRDQLGKKKEVDGIQHYEA
jgi:hypothetical protein